MKHTSEGGLFWFRKAPPQAVTAINGVQWFSLQPPSWQLATLSFPSRNHPKDWSRGSRLLCRDLGRVRRVRHSSRVTSSASDLSIGSSVSSCMACFCFVALCAASSPGRGGAEFESEHASQKNCRKKSRTRRATWSVISLPAGWLCSYGLGKQK